MALTETHPDAPAPGLPIPPDRQRRVEVRYMIGGPASDERCLRAMHGRVLDAVGVIIRDLAVDPSSLIARTVRCGGDTPALLLCPPGRERVFGRIVALVTEGLTELDLNMALIWWSDNHPAEAR